jgi:hypothetical protein
VVQAVTIVALMLLSSARPDVGDEDYQFQLAGRYVVCRADLEEVNPQHGRYYLQARISSGNESDNIDDLKAVAVSAPWIVGTSAHGCFIADSRDSGGKPEIFQSGSDWMVARRSDGIADSLLLENPDLIAARIPPATLRPYNYAILHGRLGFSDGEWGGLVFVLGIVFIFIRGIFAGPKAHLVSEALIVAIVVDVVGQMVLSGGGGPAFAGLFVYPVIFSILVKVGEFLGRTVRMRRSPRAQLTRSGTHLL